MHNSLPILMHAIQWFCGICQQIFLWNLYIVNCTNWCWVLSLSLCSCNKRFLHILVFSTVVEILWWFIFASHFFFSLVCGDTLLLHSFIHQQCSGWFHLSPSIIVADKPTVPLFMSKLNPKYPKIKLKYLECYINSIEFLSEVLIIFFGGNKGL